MGIELDDDEETGSATRKDVDKVKARAKALEANDDGIESLEDDTGKPAPVVDLRPKDEEAEDDKPTRDEKKSRRWKDVQEENDRLRRENEHKDAILALERQQRQGQQQRREEGPDEFEQPIADIYAQQEILAREIQAKADKISEQELEGYRHRGRELDARKQSLFAERVMRKQLGRVQRQTAEAAQQAILTSKYKDVYGNDTALRYAHGIALQKQATNTRGLTEEEIIDEAMNEARRVVLKRTGTRPPPTETERRRYDGGPRSRGADTGNTEAAVTEITMSKPLRKMATAAFPHLKEEDAFKKWAQGPGKRFVEGERKKGRMVG
jgi:hypothetical protein